jgi:hypothetical protein
LGGIRGIEARDGVKGGCFGRRGAKLAGSILVGMGMTEKFGWRWNSEEREGVYVQKYLFL